MKAYYLLFLSFLLKERDMSAMANLEEKVEKNEKNMGKFMKFANALWKSNKEAFKNNLKDFQEEDEIIES